MDTTAVQWHAFVIAARPDRFITHLDDLRIPDSLTAVLPVAPVAPKAP